MRVVEPQNEVPNRTAVHEIVRWNGLEFVIRLNSVDGENLGWMANSPFWEALQAAPLSPGDVILDLGAHIGSFSLLAAKYGRCRVFAFEPDLESLALCRINTLLNSLEAQVSCYPFAIGGETGEVTLYEATENWGHTIMKSGGPANVLTGKSTQVKCFSLADAILASAAPRCAFLKFNIEGAEFEMLENSDLDTLRRIAVMVGEIHLDICPHKTEILEARLGEAGFAIRMIPAGDYRRILLATQK